MAFIEQYPFLFLALFLLVGIAFDVFNIPEPRSLMIARKIMIVVFGWLTWLLINLFVVMQIIDTFVVS